MINAREQAVGGESEASLPIGQRNGPQAQVDAVGREQRNIGEVARAIGIGPWAGLPGRLGIPRRAGIVGAAGRIVTPVAQELGPPLPAATL